MQLSLFQHQENYTYKHEDYIILAENKHAYDLIINNKLWRCLILYGPSGSGKTHLAHVWQQLNMATFIDLNSFVNVMNLCNAFVLENIETVQDEVMFLHCYNYMQENGKRLLMTSSLIPSMLLLKLNDLKSRILSTMSIGVLSASEELLKLALIKQLTDRQLQVDLKVINYILIRTERSFKSISNIVGIIDNESMRGSKSITIPFVRSILNPNRKRKIGD